MDGHTETIVGKSNFDTIDKTKVHFNEPIMVYIDLLTSSLATKQTQTLILYYTNNLDDVSKITSASSNETQSIKENNNTISKNEIKDDSIIIKKPTNIDSDDKVYKDTNTADNNNEDIMLINDAPSTNTNNIKEDNTNPIPITIVILISIAAIFIGINVYIRKKR